jgi:hypothetical protein
MQLLQQLVHTIAAEPLISSDYLPKASGDKIPLFINVSFAIFGAIAVIYVVYAGIALMMSQGNPDKIATARRTIIYAIAGLVVISLSWAIVGFVYGRLIAP